MCAADVRIIHAIPFWTCTACGPRLDVLPLPIRHSVATQEQPMSPCVPGSSPHEPSGFCLLANGLYIGVGSFDRVGDCGEMLKHGSAAWQLWLFGATTTPLGFCLWHKQGPHFGWGSQTPEVSRTATLTSLVLCAALLLLGLLMSGASEGSSG